MDCNITLKDRFLKRRLSGNEEVRGYVELTNGKTYNISFLTELKVIEVTNQRGKHEKLTHEEKISIIEEVLQKYTTIWGNIIHFTATYFIEEYYLIDATQKVYELEDMHYMKKNTILQEYLESDNAEKSTNKVLRILKKYYDKVKPSRAAFKKNSKQKSIQIPIDYKLGRFRRNDLMYYIHTVMKDIFKIDEYNVHISTKDSVISVNTMN